MMIVSFEDLLQLVYVYRVARRFRTSCPERFLDADLKLRWALHEYWRERGDDRWSGMELVR